MTPLKPDQKVALVTGAGRNIGRAIAHTLAKQGFALDITAALSSSLPVPIIASGGGGNEAHFYDVFTEGKADAALAASIFHYKEVSISNLKNYLNNKGIAVRI